MPAKSDGPLFPCVQVSLIDYFTIEISDPCVPGIHVKKAAFLAPNDIVIKTVVGVCAYIIRDLCGGIDRRRKNQF